MPHYEFPFRPYVRVADRARRAEKAIAQLRKEGLLAPVRLAGPTIARTFWGKAWCDHLESHSDFANRLPRGRSYVRSGAVVDLAIEAGAVRARVQGSSLYRVGITIQPLEESRWQAIVAGCAGQIDSVIALLAGTLPAALLAILASRERGLFPAPAEMKLACSCPDWAEMCKHVAATLYGVGARLDQRPELLFVLRQVAQDDLVVEAGSARLLTKGTARAGRKLVETSKLASVFGLDLTDEGGEDEGAVRTTPLVATEAAPPSPPSSVKGRWRVGRKVSGAELVARGVPRSTFQNWLGSGGLGRGKERGVYLVTRETEARIAAVLARRGD